MKRALLMSLISVLIISCGNGQAKKQSANTNAETKTASASVVNVYYFHGKQRCKTCIAVGDIAKETVKKSYADNKNVKFIEIDTSVKGNEALVEKYNVTWNALIIAKGDDHIDITQQAFANALNSPDVLVDLIKTEVAKRLE